MHTQCTKPTNIDAVAIDHDQIKVTWHAIENPQDKNIAYDLYHRQVGQANWNMAQTTSATEHIVD